MNKEKGLTIFEVLLSLIIIGMTSTVVLILVQNYNKYLNDITYRQAYYDEYMKLYEILVLANNSYLPTQELKYLDDKWEIYVNGNLTLWMDKKSISYDSSGFEASFEQIEITSVEVKNNYLYD